MEPCESHLIPDPASATLGEPVNMDRQFSIRLEADEVARAEALVEKLGGIAKRAAVLRMALTEGLKVLEDRYRDFPGVPTPAPRSKKPRSKR